MKIYSVFLLVLVQFYWSDQANIQPRIYYGYEIDIEKAPYQAKLELKYKISNGFEFTGYCGGTLISRKHILTAAHCFYGEKNKKILPNGNRKYIIKLGTEQHVSKEWIIHEKYENREVDQIAPYDIALVTLTEEVIFSDKVQAAKLPKRSDEESDLPGQKIFVTGYGETETRKEVISALRATTLIVNENYLCPNREINPTVICASSNGGVIYTVLPDDYYLEIDQDSKKEYNPSHTGRGDSGGPAVINNTVFGVVSGHASPDSYFTSVIQFLDWINEHSGLDIKD